LEVAARVKERPLTDSQLSLPDRRKARTAREQEML
jgi:hypothetical protein